MKSSSDKTGRIRYAVVGLGYISQAAVLPAFTHASSNSILTALVSSDPVKLKTLGRKYKVGNLYSYDNYEACLNSGEIDAVYIALPNTMHRDFAVKAAHAGIHVLCEKPMAPTEGDCRAMILAAKQHSVKLMVAYRLHFEAATLSTIEAVQKGKIGEPRFIDACFSQQVKKGDIRLQKSLAGGSLYDMGIYCVNAIRYIFGAEPKEVTAFNHSVGGVDHTMAGMLRFSQDRLAVFTSSLEAADTSYFRVVGTQGDVVLEPAYDYSVSIRQRLSVKGKTHERAFPKTDQFAPELLHFSDCIHKNKEPMPSGQEGLADVRVIEALSESAIKHKSVMLGEFNPGQRPSQDNLLRRPAIARMPELVRASSPSAP